MAEGMSDGRVVAVVVGTVVVMTVIGVAVRHYERSQYMSAAGMVPQNPGGRGAVVPSAAQKLALNQAATNYQSRKNTGLFVVANGS